MKTHFKLLTTILCGGMVLCALPSQASLQITNGNFQHKAPASGAVGDVVDWFNSNGGVSWWTKAWYGPQASPNGTSVLGLGYQNSQNNWAYQNIGTNNSGFASINITLDVGSFTDAPNARNMGITLSLYQAHSFAGADNTDIDGVAGVTLIDSVSIPTGDLSAGQMVTGIVASLSLAKANTTDPLFLRISNYAVGTVTRDTGPWAAVDNVSIKGVANAPEPTSFGAAGAFPPQVCPALILAH